MARKSREFWRRLRQPFCLSFISRNHLCIHRNHSLRPCLEQPTFASTWAPDQEQIWTNRSLENYSKSQRIRKRIDFCNNISVKKINKLNVLDLIKSVLFCTHLTLHSLKKTQRFHVYQRDGKELKLIFERSNWKTNNS